MKRPPAHVLNAVRLRQEVAALIRSRFEAGKPPPPAAGLAHILARLAVVFDPDGPTVPSVQRAARALGAGDLPAALVLPEVKRAAAEGKLGRAWRLPATDTLGQLLSVSEAERSRLDLRLIGSCDLMTADRRRSRDRESAAARRRAAGAVPRSECTTRSSPWIAEGISRSTWYLRRKAAVHDEKTQVSNRTDSSSSLYSNNRRADETVQNGRDDEVVQVRPFESAPPAPPVFPGSIRDRAMRAAILPHPRVLATLKAAAGPVQISDLAAAADIRRDACRRVVGELVAGGVLHRTDRDQVAVSASITALSSAAASPNEYR